MSIALSPDFPLPRFVGVAMCDPHIALHVRILFQEFCQLLFAVNHRPSVVADFNWQEQALKPLLVLARYFEPVISLGCWACNQHRVETACPC